MERDKEVIERILQQLDVSYEVACDIYDENQRIKRILRTEAIRETLSALRTVNYDIPYTPEDIEKMIEFR